MIKKTITMLMLCLLPLIAQDDFLKGVRAEDLSLDRIEAVPAEIVEEIENMENTGMDYWSCTILSVAYSPDSTLIAELRADKPGGRIIGLLLVDSKTNTEKMIVDGIFEDLQWSPSGRYLSFIKLELVEEALKLPHYSNRKPFFNSTRFSIYDTQTGEIQDIIFLVNNRSVLFSWSPTDDCLAYSYVDNEKKKYFLVVYDAKNGQGNVIDELILCDLWNFCWSPNGKMIVYTKPLKMDFYVNEEVPVEAEIFVANRDGSGKTQITDTPESELFVKWLSDGSAIITDVVKHPEKGYESDYNYIILKK